MANPYKFIRPTPDSTLTFLQRVADGAFIPLDPSNRDYSDFLAAGSPADPAPAIVAQVVVSIRPVPLRWALRQTPDPAGNAANALAAIEAALASNAAFVDAQDAFQYAVTFERSDMIALCSQLGFTVAQVDAAMTLAATRPDSGAQYGQAS